MQNSTLVRWLSPLMAFCLTFTIIAMLAVVMGIQVDRQVDFWLLWLVTMLVLALPVCFLEIALAKRSNTTALNALAQLTRDADASAKWRLVGWLSVVFIPFMSGALVSHLGLSLADNLHVTLNTQILYIVLACLALVISFVPRQILLVIIALAVIASFISAWVLGQPIGHWHWSPIEFGEWGNATVLTLVATGLGMGIYWQNSLDSLQNTQAASKTALPIWVAQLLAVVAFAFYYPQQNIFTGLSLSLAGLVAAAILIQLAREQLKQRQISIVIQWAILLVALFVWVLIDLQGPFNLLLMLWGLVICLVYAIFAGWIMKISHLRKSMNFSHEAIYNLWRIAVRIVLPLAIIIAIIALIRPLWL